jgi:hypothetical protein
MGPSLSQNQEPSLNQNRQALSLNLLSLIRHRTRHLSILL